MNFNWNKAPEGHRREGEFFYSRDSPQIETSWSWRQISSLAFLHLLHFDLLIKIKEIRFSACQLASQNIFSQPEDSGKSLEKHPHKSARTTIDSDVAEEPACNLLWPPSSTNIKKKKNRKAEEEKWEAAEECQSLCREEFAAQKTELRVRVRVRSSESQKRRKFELRALRERRAFDWLTDWLNDGRTDKLTNWRTPKLNRV